MATHAPFPAADILRRFAVTDPVFVTQTSYARIWQVKRPDGSPAALKVYLNGMDNEVAGFALLKQCDGQGVARIYDQTTTAALIEWLGGASLGDMVRSGQDEQASRHLVQVANTLHQASQTAKLPPNTLDDWFADLFKAQFAPDSPAHMQQTLARAISLAQALLASNDPQIALHGDLHHDNIKGSPRGFLAFDAKGVLGNRHFELANAFRNPLGAEATYAKPQVIQQRAAIWAQGFNTTQTQLLHWATAQSALSLCWTAKGVFSSQHAEDIKLIDTFFLLIDNAP